MNRNNKGFTLIELLAVIVIASLVLGIAGYVTINAINNAKQKTYQVTINNIEQTADNYLNENSDKLFFISTSDGENEYQCVTIKELIETGYLKKDVIYSKVANDVTVNLDNYVYLERNTASKTLVKTQYDPNSMNEDICVLATSAIGNVQFTITPSNDTWSQKKAVKVYYKVRNVTANQIGSIKYTYRFEDEDGNPLSLTNACKSGCSDNNNIKEFEVSNPDIYLHAYLKEEDNIVAEGYRKLDKIDNVKPQIELLSHEQEDGTVKVKLKVTDETSGLNHEKNERSFTSNQIIVKNNSTQINSNKLSLELKDRTNYTATYELSINDTINNGTLSISIPDKKLYDNALNPNDAKQFSIEVNYAATPGKVIIKYDMNGGEWDTHNAQYSNNGTIITKDGSEEFHTVSYGQSLGENGLYNWNNPDFINLKKTGMLVVTGEEWCLQSGKCFDQKYDYAASEFCDASKGDCTVTLYANWKGKPIRIFYHQNGGTIQSGSKCRAGEEDPKTCYSRNSWAAVCNKTSCNESDRTYAYQVCNPGSECNLWDYNNANYLNIKRAGYIAKSGEEWCTKGESKCFDHDEKSYSYDELKAASAKEETEYYELSLYVKWVEQPVRVYFNINNANSINGECGVGDKPKRACVLIGQWAATCEKTSCSGASDYSYAYQQYDYNETDDLRNVSAMDILRNNYYANPGSEWMVSSGDNLNQDTRYSYAAIKAKAIAQNGEATTSKPYYVLNLYVNWQSVSSSQGKCGACSTDADCKIGGKTGTCTGTCASLSGSYKCCILSDGSMCS